MNLKKTLVLQPEYVKRFVCDGSVCEDNCCKGQWVIYVDEKHYKMIKNVRKKDLTDKIQKYIRRNRNNPGKGSYGIIHQDTAIDQCIFLTEEKLCEIQKELGKEYLCEACNIYPRVVKTVDGKYERSLNVSCPLAAKEALLDFNPMAFEQIEEYENHIIKIHGELSTEADPYIEQFYNYFWDIRLFCISLLQNRDYLLEDRLVIMGIVYKKIQELYEAGKANNIPDVLESVVQLIESNAFSEELKRIVPNIGIQIQLIKAMIEKKLSLGVGSERYLECYKEFLVGLKYSDNAKAEDIITRYSHNYKEYYLPYMKEKEFIIENYLVNEYFKQLMPFGEFKTIWDSYIFLCLLYSVIKLNLIGMSGYHKGLNDDLIVKLIQSFSKEIIHNTYFTREIIKTIKDNEYDSLAYMSILLKS